MSVLGDFILQSLGGLNHEIGLDFEMKGFESEGCYKVSEEEGGTGGEEREACESLSYGNH